MGVLLVCLVAVILLEPTEGKICSRITDFTLFDSNNRDAKEACQNCPKCQPGQGLVVQCGSRVPYGTFTGCEQCKVNKTYSKNNDISHCKPCNQCGFKIVLQQCTPLQNSKCADACITGYKLDPILDACFVVPGNKTTTTSTKSPTTTKVPTAILSLAPTTRSAGTSAPVGRIATNNNSTTADPRTKLQSKPVNNYTTEPPVVSQDSKLVQVLKILGGCLGGVVFIFFIIYTANKLRRSNCKTHSCEGVERGEELPLTEFQNKDHLVNKPPNETDDGRTTPPFEDHSHKNSATTSSTESVPAGNEESTRDDNPNLDVQRIPEDRVVSDMDKLHHNNQVMLHSVQKKLDARETLQQKTWRGVGMALRVSSEDLDLIETCYLSQKSPTEELVRHLNARGDAEPSMREFCRALIACERDDVARIIINWPRWEINDLENDSS